MDACQLSHHGTHYRLGCNIWSVEVSLTQRNYARALALLSSHISLVEGCEQRIDTWAYCSRKGLALRHGQCHYPKCWCASLALMTRVVGGASKMDSEFDICFLITDIK